MLLQVLDDGRLTDGQGHTVDFRNTLIIMTSNLGSEYLAAQPDGESVELVRGKVLDTVKAAFRPEFLNRVDEILLFHRLERGQMGAIVDIPASAAKAADTREIGLEVTPAARDWLANEGYDPVYGARPLKRVIQRSVQDEMAEKMLAGEIVDGSTVKVDAGDGSLLIMPVLEGETVDAAAQ